VPGCGSLDIARRQVSELRRQVNSGVNPVAERDHKKLMDEEQRRIERERFTAQNLARELARLEAERKLTFNQLADKYVNQHAKQKRSGKSDQRRIDRYLRPRWGERKLEDICKADVRALLDPIRDEGKKAELQHVRALVSGIFNFAIAEDVVQLNPCAGLPKRKGDAVKPRTRALKTEKELRLVWALTDRTRRHRRLPIDVTEALRFMLLTGCRPGEATGLRWEEIDFNRAEWSKPDADPGRAKSGRADVLPLVPELIEMLVARRGNNSPFVWPSGRSKRNANGGGPGSLTPNKLAQELRVAMPVVRRLRIETFRPHDLRTTVATWLGMLQVRSHVIERVLNHARRGVTDTHYNMHEYVPEKREALERWATNLRGIVGAARIANPVARIGRKKA
jgi:integrase